MSEDWSVVVEVADGKDEVGRGGSRRGTIVGGDDGDGDRIREELGHVIILKN